MIWGYPYFRKHPLIHNNLFISSYYDCIIVHVLGVQVYCIRMYIYIFICVFTFIFSYVYTYQPTSNLRASGLRPEIFKSSQATAMRFIGAVIEAATIKAPFSWSFNQLKDKRMRSTWNSKQPVFNECFNWMIPNHYIKNGCLTKHPLKTGCLEFQEER